MVSIGGTPYPDLEAAVQAALPNDVISVSGTEDVPRTLHVTAPLTIAGVAGATVRSVTDAVDLFDVTGALTLTALRIEPVGDTRAAYVHDGGALSLVDVDIEGGAASHGGQVRVSAGALDVVDGSFVGGRAAYGGLFYLEASTANFSGGLLSAGTAGDPPLPSPSGGALDLHDSTVSLTGTRIEGNATLAHAGGGIGCHGAVQLALTNVDLVGNTAPDAGGALFAFDGPTVTVVDGSFEGNSAADGGAVSLGGSAPGAATFSGTRFVGNEADSGGDLAARGVVAVEWTDVVSSGAHARVDGASLLQDGGAVVTVTGGRIEGARADDDAAAFHVYNGHLTATRVHVCDAVSGDTASVLYAGNGAAVALRNLTVQRSAAGNRAGIRSDGTADVLVDHVTVVDASAPQGGSAVEADGSSTHAVLASLFVADEAPTLSLRGSGALDVDGTFFPADQLPAGASGTVRTLATDPFPGRDPAGCGDLVPDWTGSLVNGATPLRDPFPGAVGGPESDDALWDDTDGDGVPAMWDCDPADGRVYPDATGDCGPHPGPHTGLAGHTGAAGSETGAPVDTGSPPAETADPTTPDGGADVAAGKVGADPGCGCGTGAGPAWPAPWLALAVGRRRRRPDRGP